MITFLLPRVAMRHTIERYLERVENPWPVEIVNYEDLEPDTELGPGVYVFADLERLESPMIDLALGLRQRLESDPGTVCLNGLRTWLDRTAFLRALYAAGVNDFDVHPARMDLRPNRFPVFLRHRWDHTGALTPLIHTEEDLREELSRHESLDDLVVAEFSDTADERGIYRKYSAFRVGHRVIPRHVFFSRDWMIKSADLTDADLVEEELHYVRDNPHAELVAGLFERSGVEWGRIDYAFAGDAVRVWEINTNPTLVPVGDWGSRADAHNLFLDRLHQAFEELEAKCGT